VGPETLRRIYPSLRPHGGKLFVLKRDARRADLEQLVEENRAEGAALEECGEYLVIARKGGLPGAGNWTHEHADAANTRVSKDTIVRAPLGLLWFGGPSHEGILPRHGHGPQPQVLDGRLLVEGVDMLRAMDIYTGRVLWEAKLPGVGRFYNNTLHQPGANAAGTNFISRPDGIYVAYGKKCLRLDPASGERTSEFALPDADPWTYVNVEGDYLVGCSEAASEYTAQLSTDAHAGNDDDPVLKKLASLFKGAENDNLSSSRRLTVLDRSSGKPLWTAVAQVGFRHNSICIGNGRLYAIDRISGPAADRMKRRGETEGVELRPRLAAFDLATGKELWSTTADVFGTFLSCSVERDLLIESGRRNRDTLNDEPKGMRAYRGADGKVLWQKDHAGPAMISGDTVFTDTKACDLLTGNLKTRIHPITGQTMEWQWARNYGCNTPLVAQNIITFRSGAAGYFDLGGDGGTGNFGGFRSSCTNNLIVAGGVICAPDYTRTCTCSYQNQCSLALVPMPENEMWTFYGSTEVKGAVKRVGINLGAPGDRRAPDGTLWLEFPATTGKSPAVMAVSIPEDAGWWRRHPSRVEGPLPWVAASGARALKSLRIGVDPDAKGESVYTVRLHFAEPDDKAPGERVFDVSVQGNKVLEKFDVVREAGAPRRGVVKEFRGVPVQGGIEIALEPEGVLAGVELEATPREPAAFKSQVPPIILKPAPEKKNEKKEEKK
jgi:outer membrane protein assembly factor BamB